MKFQLLACRNLVLKLTAVVGELTLTKLTAVVGKLTLREISASREIDSSRNLGELTLREISAGANTAVQQSGESSSSLLSSHVLEGP